jgi:hypothetical protein
VRARARARVCVCVREWYALCVTATILTHVCVAASRVVKRLATTVLPVGMLDDIELARVLVSNCARMTQVGVIVARVRARVCVYHSTHARIYRRFVATRAACSCRHASLRCWARAHS